jgi:glycerol-3-phosphate acyltransferase PlsY
VVWVLNHGADFGLDERTAAAAGITVFLGHLFPVFFKFKGGKGVATALGVLMGISPLLGIAVALTWLSVAWFTRYSSLAALMAAILAPVYYALLGDVVWWSFDGAIFALLCAMGTLLVWRHRDNVNRLIAGTETKIGAKK